MITRTSKTLTVLTLATSLIAWRALADPMTLAAESKLWIEGTSSVKSFTCKAPVMTASVGVANAEATKAVLGGEKAVQTARFEVTADKMDCGDDTMNKHMLKALKAKENPAITFTLSGYELFKSADSTKGTIDGKLRIGGVEQVVSLPVSFQAGTDGGLRVKGAREINMRDYKLDPPSLMMGMMKVREKVTVRFDLLLK